MSETPPMRTEQPPLVPSMQFVQIPEHQMPDGDRAADVGLVHLLQQLADARRAEREAKAEVEDLLGKIKACIGDGESTWLGPVPLATVQRIAVSRLDTKRLQADHPDLASQYMARSQQVRVTLHPMITDGHIFGSTLMDGWAVTEVGEQIIEAERVNRRVEQERVTNPASIVAREDW